MSTTALQKQRQFLQTRRKLNKNNNKKIALHTGIVVFPFFTSL